MGFQIRVKKNGVQKIELVTPQKLKESYETTLFVDSKICRFRSRR